MYVILKQVQIGDGIVRPVILIDDHSEILEFETQEEAERLRTLFETNSTHGSKYEVKKV